MDSIAQPTVPGGNPEQTSDAAPADTPKPTDPPNTSLPEDDKPTKTVLPEEDPEETSDSEVKPPSFGPDDEDSPSEDNGDDPKETQRPAEPTNQPDQDDSKDDPPASKPDDSQQEGSKQDPPAEPKPSNAADEANEGSGNEKPANPNNPISVIFSAIESTNAAETGTAKDQDSSDSPASGSHNTDSSPESAPAGEKKPANAQDPNNDSEPEPFTENASPPEPTVIALPGGGSATFHSASGSVIIEQEGLSAGAAHGSIATIGTHVYSAAPDGSAIVVDGSVTHAAPAPAPAVPTGNKDNDAAAEVWTHAGETFSAVLSGSTIALQGSDLTTTMSVGAVATFAGVEISVPASGGMLVHGGNTVTLEQGAGKNKEGSVATTFDLDGDKIVASPTGSEVVFQQGGSSITLAAGQETTFNGKTYSLAPSGGVVAVDGSEVSLPVAAAETLDSAVATLVHDGETFTASATGDDVVLHYGSSTVTVSAGKQTVVDGQTFSVAPSGGAVVVNGTETVELSDVRTEDATATSTATRTASVSASDADEGASGTDGSEPSSTAAEVDADSAAAKVASGLSLFVVGAVSFIVMVLVV